MVLVENNIFKLCGNIKFQYCANELLSLITQNHKRIKDFFHINDYPQITINLFMTKEELERYLSMNNKQMEIEEYSLGCFSDFEINQVCNQKNLHMNIYQTVNIILHEYTHIMYQTIYKGKYQHIAWIDEGLAQYLSGEKKLLDNNVDRLKSYFLRSILHKSKQIPKLNQLHEYGIQKNKFNNSLYNGYAISYMLIRYMLENNYDFFKIIQNEELIIKLENSSILSCMLNYYGAKFNLTAACILFNKISNPKELMEYMDTSINYGWIDNTGLKHVHSLLGFKLYYRVNTIEQIVKNNLGTCIEQAKLQKYIFDKLGYINKIYCDHQLEIADEKPGIEMHIFTIYLENDIWHLFEHANYKKRGIKKYYSLDELLEDYRNTMKKDHILTEIPNIPDGLSYIEFNQFLNKCDEQNKQ